MNVSVNHTVVAGAVACKRGRQGTESNSIREINERDGSSGFSTSVIAAPPANGVSLVRNERDWAVAGGRRNGRRDVDALNEKKKRFLLGLKFNLPEGIVDDWESVFEVFNKSVDPALCSKW